MNNFKNLSDRYKMFGYEITDEPDFLDKEFGITPEIREHIYELYFEAHEPERGTIKKLKTLIKNILMYRNSKTF